MTNTLPTQTDSARFPTGPFRHGTIAGYEEREYVLMSDETGAFASNIYRAGVHVLTATHDGYGASNRYTAPDDVDFDAEMNGFRAATEAVLGTPNSDGSYESDMFVMLLSAAADCQAEATNEGISYGVAAERDRGFDDELTCVLRAPQIFSDDYVFSDDYDNPGWAAAWGSDFEL